MTLTPFSSELRAFMSGSLAAGASADDEEFNRLALALFAFQYANVSIYREFCARKKVAPDSIHDWRDIPALPTSAFKDYEVSSIREGQRTRVFHSSGTTGQTPSRHFHSAESLSVYEASLLPWFERHFFVSQPPPMKLLFLAPESAPHSSLVHMFATVRRQFGTGASAFAGWLEGDGSWNLNLKQIVDEMREAIGENKPIGLLGTAFSFVQLLDHLQSEGKRYLLPKGSRLMETGGYKGRTRVVPRALLRLNLSKFLGVPASHVLGEYGMSELSSQGYDNAAGEFLFPPWARARIISPETGAEANDGETGLLRVFDLANIGSVMAVQTEDLARRRCDRFELQGRAESAEPRGCSLKPGI